MANVTVGEIRLIAGWTSTEAPDLTNQIAIGDGWLNKIIDDNGETDLSTLTSSDANRGALAKGAELYYVAYLWQSRPPKNDDFQYGPIRSHQTKAEDRIKSTEYYLKMAKEMLDKAGLFYEAWPSTYAGGDDYHPEFEDDTQIDFGLANTDSDYPLNILGIPDGVD